MIPTATARLGLASEAGVFSFRDCRHGVMAFLRTDETIGRALDVHGEFAESANRILTALLAPGDTAVDVGANVGTVALALAAAVGPTGRVIAFEPQRLVFQALCANLTVNGFAHVLALRAAVGRASGEVRIPSVDPTIAQNFGGVCVTQDPAGDRVPLVALDSLNLPACAVLKTDAEGMDYDVLLGAAATIDRTRPAVYFEGGGEAPAAIAFLIERRYRCYWHFASFAAPDSFRPGPDVFGLRGDLNVLALPLESPVRVALPAVSAADADWRRDYARFLAEWQSALRGSRAAQVGLTDEECHRMNDERLRREEHLRQPPAQDPGQPR
jgi:FkbM family methyltransferase